MEHTLDWSESVGEKMGELAYEPQVIAVEFFDGQLVEMLAEQTEVMKKGEAADHCVAFRLVEPWIESRNGAAAVDEAIAKGVGNYPASQSNTRRRVLVWRRAWYS